MDSSCTHIHIYARRRRNLAILRIMTIIFFGFSNAAFIFFTFSHLLDFTFSHLLYYTFSHLLDFTISHILYYTFSHLLYSTFLHLYIFTSLHFHIFCIFELLYSSFFLLWAYQGVWCGSRQSQELLKKEAYTSLSIPWLICRPLIYTYIAIWRRQRL